MLSAAQRVGVLALLLAIPALVSGHASALEKGEDQGPKVDDLVVLGVIASTRPGEGIALVSDPRRGTAVLREGDVLDVASENGLTRDPSRVVRVEDKYVYFEIAGETVPVRVGDGVQLYRQEARADTSPKLPAANQLTEVEHSNGLARISSMLRDHLVKDRLQEVLVQAQALPYFEDGELRGFRLDMIDPGSIFERLGIQDRDVVTEINGVPIRDVATTIRYLRSLATESEVELVILRDGTEKLLRVEVL